MDSMIEANQIGNGGVTQVLDIATSLVREIQHLAHDSAVADVLAATRIDISKGMDFYGEVERFEIALIRLALHEVAGNQTRAARLLCLRPSTLHAKIKLYGIQFERWVQLPGGPTAVSG